MNSVPEKQSWRRTSIDSLGSDGSFDGEMDQFIDDILRKKKNTDNMEIKKEPDEDNISEEKVKLELEENEKGRRALLSSKESKTDASDSDHWSDSELSDRWSSPEPEDPLPLNKNSTSNIPPVSDVPSPTNMGSEQEPVERSPSRQDASYDEDDDDIEELNLKDDQQKALYELQQFKLDLHKARYTDEEPPEYDVAERVRLLNQELANSPTPVDDERARSIKFKDNLVDLVAPPPDYPSDDDSGGPSAESRPVSNSSSQGQGDSSVNNLKLGHMNLNDNEEGSGDASRSGGDSPDGPEGQLPGTTDGENSNQERLPQDQPPPAPPPPPPPPPMRGETLQESSQQKSKSEEVVLVERDGTFELVSVSDLTAEERNVYLIPQESAPSPATPDSNATIESSHSSSSMQPTPPRHPRPATASSAQTHRRAVNSAGYHRRVQSATPSRGSDHAAKFNSDYQSPYAIPSHLKKVGEKRLKEKEQRERQEKEIKRLEEDQKRRENEDAFLAWKNNKRKEASEHDQSKPPQDQRNDKDRQAWVHNDEDQSSQKSEAAFNEWMKAKRNQMRREKHETELIKKEEEKMMEDRPRQESDKAFRQYVFKEWLKKKNHETKKAKKQEVSRTRIRQLLVRRTRKAMQLARAIQKSQTFRYVDYYGYRF